MATAVSEPVVVQRRTRVPLPPKLRAPGWYRAALFEVLGFGFSVGLDVLIRWAQHQHPVIDGNAITIIALLAVPIFFLIGIGTFDYWLYWAVGRPTRPEDHSTHGALTWRDYFRVNTDHKVIGIQYTVTSFFFLFVGGLLAMLIRAQLAKPGMQFLTPEQFNGVFSVHATLLIFLFVIPVFAGLANFVLPLMIGAPDMAFPRLNALSYWLLPLAGIMMLMSFLAPGGSFASGWTAYAPLSTTMPLGQLFFTIAVQLAGASSIATALNFLVAIITMRAPGMSFFGMPPWIRTPMMITTAVIAIPTGIKIFSWLATLWRGVLHLDTPMLFALGFLTMFTLGGISGVMLAMIPFDIHVSQTYFIVAHIHYVLFGGSLFTIFAGVYYWFPKMTGRMFDDRLGKLHFWSTFIFFNLTFGPLHLIGIQGMPRRVAEYADKFAAWNLFISLSAFILGLSTLIFLYNIIVSWRFGPRAPANPWRGLTLEWQGLPPPPDLHPVP